jgi:hypothetical protein
MIQFAIPSSNRCELLDDTTLRILRENRIKLNTITIFVPKKQTIMYESAFPDIKIVGCEEIGIGRTRTFIRKYYPVGTKLIMIDDDILGIKSIEDSFWTQPLHQFFNSCFTIMKEEDVKFAGFCPYDNEFYMKEGYSLTPKYTGGHLILEIIRENPIEVYINHFEDYVANALYYLMDGKLLRFNGTYVKTKYFNPKGGIVDYYGSLDKRKQVAEKLAEKIRFIFKGLLLTCHNKTHDVINLKFKSKYRVNDGDTREILDTYKHNAPTLEEYAI